LRLLLVVSGFAQTAMIIEFHCVAVVPPETRQTIMTLSPSTVLGNRSDRQGSRTLVRRRDSDRRNRS
jgi:hypothetical protein